MKIYGSKKSFCVKDIRQNYDGNRFNGFRQKEDSLVNRISVDILLSRKVFKTPEVKFSGWVGGKYKVVL